MQHEMDFEHKSFRISDITEPVTWKEAQTGGCASRPASQSFCSRTPSLEDTPKGSCLNTHTHTYAQRDTHAETQSEQSWHFAFNCTDMKTVLRF